MPNVPRIPKPKTLEIIDLHLIYFPISGSISWINPKSFSVKNGQRFGCLNNKGYLSGNINKQSLKAHHIAWYKFYGYWPEAQLDHINRSRDDNSIINLRESNEFENRWNSGPNISNNTGYKGIIFITEKWHRKRYKLDISIVNIRYAKYFLTLQEAIGARDEFISANCPYRT